MEVKELTINLDEFCLRWDIANHDGKEALCELNGMTYLEGKNYRRKFKRREPPSRPDEVAEETQVAVWSDHHSGEITPTYNKEIYKERVDNLVDSTLTIANLHRNMYPVKKLVLMLVGDMVHGENPRQGAKVEGISDSVLHQIHNVSVPQIKKSVSRLKESFDEITIEAVPGNHGRYDKVAPDSTNWDTFLYASLKSELAPLGINVNYSDTFYKMVDINGFRFFLFHGHQVRTYQGIPFAGLMRKLMSWYVTFGGFQYAICGHWHNTHNISVSSQTELFMNGALPTDDPFALEMVGTSSAPKQWTFGVHNRMGVTWRYPLFADYSFLPRQCR